jgi:hypothetical protein
MFRMIRALPRSALSSAGLQIDREAVAGNIRTRAAAAAAADDVHRLRFAGTDPHARTRRDLANTPGSAARGLLRAHFFRTSPSKDRLMIL